MHATNTSTRRSSSVMHHHLSASCVVPDIAPRQAISLSPINSSNLSRTMRRAGMSCALLLRLCDCSRDLDYLHAQLNEADVELAPNSLCQFPAQCVHLFLVKPRCVPLNSDSHRSRNDHYQVVPKPQPR